jgi:hypothetical protein
VQVLIYRRGLASWDGLAHESDVDPAIGGKRQAREPAAGGATAPQERRFDPRAISLAAAVAFGLLLASTDWALLAAVALWLTVAWGAARPDKQPLRAGLLFAALLSGGAFAFALGGGLGLDVAARRAARAALLVLTATWLRGAAGADGLREVSRRALGRLRRLPALPEASLVLDQIASEGRLAAAARTLEQQLRGVPKRAMPFVDAVLHWVVREANRPHTPAPRRAIELSARPADLVLLIAAVLPALAL